MKSIGSIHKWLFAALANFFLATAVLAAGPTKEEAKAMTEKAVAYIKEVGTEKAFKEFNTNPGPWVKGELYVLAYDYKGDNLVLGANPKMNGKNLWDIKSPDGKFVVREFVDMVKNKGSGWVDYEWKNPDPAVNKVQPKTTYVTKVPGMDAVVGVGIYVE